MQRLGRNDGRGVAVQPSSEFPVPSRGQIREPGQLCVPNLPAAEFPPQHRPPVGPKPTAHR